jgi:hypothetical protein
VEAFGSEVDAAFHTRATERDERPSIGQLNANQPAVIGAPSPEESTASFDQLALLGGSLSAFGHGLHLLAPATAWRSAEISDLASSQNLDADLEAGPRRQ